MTAESLAPLISIGLPVRNEAPFLRQTLDALLAQTGVDIEVIISDNASDDGTEDICRDYAQRHACIHYHRYATNMGATNNFAYVLEHATGSYFMWAAGHDLWDSNYLQECVRAFDDNPSAVLAFGSTHWIDAAGGPYPRVTGWCDTRGMTDIARYFAVFWGNMNPIVALIRITDLRTLELEEVVGGDLVILLGLVLRGDFVHAVGTRWYRREFRREQSHKQKLQRYQNQGFLAKRSWFSRTFPLARLPVRIVSDLFRAELPLGRRILIFLVLLISFPTKYLADKARKNP